MVGDYWQAGSEWYTRYPLLSKKVERCCIRAGRASSVQLCLLQDMLLFVELGWGGVGWGGVGWDWGWAEGSWGARLMVLKNQVNYIFWVPFGI